MSASHWISEEGESLRRSALNIFVGKCIGSGASRRVYALHLDRTKVLKVEYEGFKFHNIAEWQVWEAVKDTPLEDWFAPCHEIDAFGNCLLQSRTEPFQSEKTFHAELKRLHGHDDVPTFFDDVHFGNFGMLEGRIVCHDYGYNNFLRMAVKEWSADKPGVRSLTQHSLPLKAPK